MPRPTGLLATAVSGTLTLLAECACAYNSEEHKLLVDMGAALVRIDPSIQLPAPTGMRTRSLPERRAYFRNAKFFAVGDSTNNNVVNDQRKGCQDNSYWSGNGWDQWDYNRKIYIPKLSEVRETLLEVTGYTAPSAQGLYTMGELAAFYGDYRRTVYCQTGTCYLTNGNAANIRFDMGEDCFGPPLFRDCGWQPGPFAFDHYLRYIGSGLVPPYDPTLSGTGHADPADYDEAVWWGDEMFRIATANDTHFSSGAVAWYVGCHRMALYYASLARDNPAYWNQALHYEAAALHSFTDLFAFGHVVTNADRRTFGIAGRAGVRDSHPYRWMEHVLGKGGGSRDGEGRVSLDADVPAPAEYSSRQRVDYMNTTTTLLTWGPYGVAEADFHDCYNQSGGTVRNLAGDRFTIYGDGDFERTVQSSREIIAEAVRLSIQSVFDGYVELGRGRTLAQVLAAGSPFYAALKKLPVFVESSPRHEYDGWLPENDVTTGHNYDGEWTLFAEFLDELTGTHIVPVTPCVMRYEDGNRYIEPVQPAVPCTSFPVIVPPPPGVPPEISLEQSFPNPFATSATIRYSLSRPARVVLEVFDLAGGKIRTLVDEERALGQHFAIWDATRDDGQRVRAGLYTYRLSIDGETLTKAMTFVP